MKNLKVFLGVGLLLSAVGIGLFNAIPKDEFTAFKQEKMRLEESPEPIVITAVGDIMLSRGVALKNKQVGNQDVFSDVKKSLDGDIVFGNLENPITKGREIQLSEMVLRADPDAGQILKEAGFNLLSLANNHTADFGRKGISDTIKYLQDANIRWVGARGDSLPSFEPQYFEVNGIVIAFLAFSDPSLREDTKDGEPEKVLQEAVKKARKEADAVIVSMHAGAEYVLEPDQTQIKFAHNVVDAGADLVLGHHPHVAQKVEVYKGKYIFYSLGNFVFDQLWSEDTRISIITKIYLNQAGVVKIDFIPIFIDDNARPVEITGKKAEKILKRLHLKLVQTSSSKYTHLPDNFSEFRLTKKTNFDLDKDGVKESYFLKDGSLQISTEKKLIWQSPDTWWVDYYVLKDSNNDGLPELNLLVWKKGSFGESKPFWVTEEDKSIKNHLFVYKLKEGALKPIWQSSNLDNPNYYIEFSDLNEDGENELIAIEGSYSNTKERWITFWKWNGWGFSRIKKQ